MSLVKADTPMMRQFNALKEAYPDCILFFRAGDFYEMFGEDAKVAAEALQIALTTRNKSSENEVPMCGVPYHAYEQYLNKLTAQGFKVAIAEQMEDPAQAKGLVRREVTRVVTPGTTVSGALLAGDQHLFLVALEARHAEGALGAAWVDLSTGLFEVAEFAPGEQGHLLEVLRLDAPREVLLPEPRSPKERERQAALQALLLERLGGQAGGPPAVQEVSAAWFDPAGAAKRLARHFRTGNLAGFGVEGLSAGMGAAGALLAYLAQTQKTDLAHLTHLRQRSVGRCMRLDESTLRHLEVFENPSPGGGRHTLFAVLNLTKTAMGARLLRRWLGEPLLDAAPLEARLDAVEELQGAPVTREALRQVLARIRDLERCIARISLPVAGVADVVALREALGNAQFLPPLLGELRSPLLREMAEGFDALEDVHRYLRERLHEEPSLRLTEGGFIAQGVLPELDRLRELARDSKAVMAALEAREREKTGIGSLKVRFNRVFGYYLEVSRVHGDKIPPGYQRKQTLANAERFTTPELQEIEEQLLHAEERGLALELEEFQSIRTILGGYARRMQATALRIATVDALAALAQVAHENGYVRPRLLTGPEPRRLSLVQARHPVIERIAFDEAFIPNDVLLDAREQQILLITGPNMAGKSTVMRQVALIQLMAQAGSFVPAQAAELSLVDRLFTRVGAADNLSRGQSTFMLEMNEAANILHHATPNSLIVLDEIGRGTSTFDGISIAWAMVEHLHALGPLTLCATHYHELTRLAHELPRVKNFNMAIQEEGERLVFPRKLVPGEADKSYGIQVARLAGLPAPVVARASQVLQRLVEGRGKMGRNGGGASRPAPKNADQLTMLPAVHPLVEQVRALKLEGMTPLEALNTLAHLQGYWGREDKP